MGGGLAERTVRICESRERRREGGKAKNERNRKTSNRKTFVGQARKQSKEGSCRGVVMGVHRRAPVAHFHVCYSERGHTHAFNFLAIFFFLVIFFRKWF